MGRCPEAVIDKAHIIGGHKGDPFGRCSCPDILLGRDIPPVFYGPDVSYGAGIQEFKAKSGPQAIRIKGDHTHLCPPYIVYKGHLKGGEVVETFAVEPHLIGKSHVLTYTASEEEGCLIRELQLPFIGPGTIIISIGLLIPYLQYYGGIKGAWQREHVPLHHALPPHHGVASCLEVAAKSVQCRKVLEVAGRAGHPCLPCKCRDCLGAFWQG